MISGATVSILIEANSIRIVNVPNCPLSTISKMCSYIERILPITQNFWLNLSIVTVEAAKSKCITFDVQMLVVYIITFKVNFSLVWNAHKNIGNGIPLPTGHQGNTLPYADHQGQF